MILIFWRLASLSLFSILASPPLALHCAFAIGLTGLKELGWSLTSLFIFPKFKQFSVQAKY